MCPPIFRKRLVPIFFLAYLVALSPEVSGTSFSYVDWCPPFCLKSLCPNIFLKWRCPPFPKRSPAVQISKGRKVRREMKLLFFSLYSSRDKLCTNIMMVLVLSSSPHTISLFFICISLHLRSALVLLPKKPNSESMFAPQLKFCQ